MKRRSYFMETARLTFGYWEAGDEALATALWGDREVTRYISKDGYTPGQIRERWQKERENRKYYGLQYWPLFLRNSQEFIGCCGLRAFDYVPNDLEKDTYELGFHLKKAYWGQGYAREAAEAVIRHAFDRLGARYLFAGHHPENRDSERLLKKLGFHATGKVFYPPTGLTHPAYRLYKEDYRGSDT